MGFCQPFLVSSNRATDEDVTAVSIDVLFSRGVIVVPRQFIPLQKLYKAR